jgi:valyl-tRNA synthetase
MNREIPIFGDSYVDMEFGTGFVKVTPAHDPNDFEMGKRHNLEEIIIMDENAVINENGGLYKGLDRYDARKKIVSDLDAAGLLVKTEKHIHSVGHCYRCSSVVEPYLSKQWFVKIKPLADEAIKVVEDGRIRFVPKNWEKTYFEWMYNIRDWCISRQLWWGHRIPAFYCDDCDHITVSMEDPIVCEKCGSDKIRQDEDVLDTWFSSALWPFSTMGWPDDTAELKKYYPTSVLVTGFDIIFFWVARMIMTGVKFMNEIPFRDVYIHALVRDEHGQKMSKSKGNVIDPLIMMDKYGSDAFRFTLAAFAAQGRDIILSEKRIEGYSSFCNKIWNATRFILMNLSEDFMPKEIDLKKLEVFDKWILNTLNDSVKRITESLEQYKFNEAASQIYDFWWHEFCDWYLELVKQRIYSKESNLEESSNNAKQVLYYVLKKSLLLMHPFMPFITEEIWSRIKSKEKSKEESDIIISEWPIFNESLIFSEESNYTNIFKEIIYKIRNIRGEMNIPPDKKGSVIFKASNELLKKIIETESVHIQALAKVDSITIDSKYIPDKTDSSAVMSDLEIFVPLKGLIDIEKEIHRIEKEIAKIKLDLDKVVSKLGNENFRKNAPQEIIEKESAKEREYLEILGKLEESLGKIKG